MFLTFNVNLGDLFHYKNAPMSFKDLDLFFKHISVTFDVIISLYYLWHTCKLAVAFSSDLHACLFCVKCAITKLSVLTMLNRFMIYDDTTSIII